jgi:hypothetical protein
MDFDLGAIFEQILGIFQWIMSLISSFTGGEGFDLGGLLGGLLGGE